MDTIRSHTLGSNTHTRALDKFWWGLATHITNTHIWCVVLNYHCSKVFWFQFLSDLVHGTCTSTLHSNTNFKQIFGNSIFLSRFASAKLSNFTNNNHLKITVIKFIRRHLNSFYPFCSPVLVECMQYFELMASKCLQFN